MIRTPGGGAKSRSTMRNWPGCCPHPVIRNSPPTA